MSEKERTEKLRENVNQDHRKTATDSHSTSGWQWVPWLVGLVLISWSLSGSHAMAQECYKCGFSKVGNVPHFNADCTDTANYEDHGCSLWRSVKGCCIDKDQSKCHSQECYNNYGCVLFGEGKCHFLLVPTDPVIGVEDKNNREKYHYWYWAWYAAQQGIWKIKHHTSTSLGLAINPAAKRSQHQLHIHIGRLKKPLRDMLQAKHVKGDGEWYLLTIDGKHCYAKFFKGFFSVTDKSGFPRPFTEVSNHFGEENMKHAGIIVAGSYYNEPAGFYIVRYYDVYVEGLLNYECLTQ